MTQTQKERVADKLNQAKDKLMDALKAAEDAGANARTIKALSKLCGETERYQNIVLK